MKKLYLFGLLSALVLSSCTIKGGSGSMKGSENENIDTTPLIGRVSVDKPELVFILGETEPQSVTVSVDGTHNYDKSATISVENTSVCTVNMNEIESGSSFIVAPVSGGDTVITVKSVQDEEKVAAVNVKVVQNSAPATPLALDVASKDLLTGQSFTLNATANSLVVWSIDVGGEEIVELQNVAEKSVTVKARNEEGTAYVRATLGYESVTCSVNVSKPSVTSKTVYFTNSLSWAEVHGHLLSEAGESITYTAGTLSDKSINDFNEEVFAVRDIDLTTYKYIVFSDGTSSHKTEVINLTTMGDKNNIYILLEDASGTSKVEYATYVEPTPYVSFVGENIVLYIGGEFAQMIHISSGNGDVAYQVADPAYLEILSYSNSDICIKGLAVGNTTITATNGEATDTLNVSVIEAPTPSIAITGESSLEEFKSIDLTCEANYPGVTWSVHTESEAGVVSLSNQSDTKVTVNGLKEGTATIRATIRVGDNTFNDDHSLTIIASTDYRTFYFTNNYGWDKVYVYAFENDYVHNAAWPGVELLDPIMNGQDQDVYEFRFNPSQYSYLIFNNNDGQQTVDIAVSGIIAASKDNFYISGTDDAGHYTVDYANFTAPTDLRAEFADSSLDVFVNQTITLHVDSNTKVSYESSDDSKVAILSHTNRSVTVKALAVGSATINSYINSSLEDSIVINVTNPGLRDFYFYNTYDHYTDFSLYLFGPDNAENAPFPGVAFNPSGTTYKDAVGQLCYKVSVDLSLYDSLILSGKDPNEGNELKQTRNISFSEITATSHNCISMDPDGWFDNGDKWVVNPLFETFSAYDNDATTRRIYLDVGTDLGGSSYWKGDNATFFIHAWGGASDFDSKLTKVTDDLYYVDINKSLEHMIFVRMAPEATAIDWDNLWNKSNDLDTQSNKNLYKITSWGTPCGGVWRHYAA